MLNTGQRFEQFSVSRRDVDALPLYRPPTRRSSCPRRPRAERSIPTALVGDEALHETPLDELGGRLQEANDPAAGSTREWGRACTLSACRLARPIPTLSLHVRDVLNREAASQRLLSRHR